MIRTVKLCVIAAIALLPGWAALAKDVRQAAPSKPDVRVEPQAAATRKVTLRFKAAVGDRAFRCGETYPGVGATKSTIKPTDFKMFVHDVRLVDERGREVPVALDQDRKWQYKNLALVDFENGEGPCSNGSKDTHDVVTGTVPVGRYTGVRFTLGVPFDLNHEDPIVLPSPLNLTQMFWVWNSGFKFLRLDLTSTGQPNGLFVHLGSTNCTPSESVQDPPTSCAHPNRVAVSFSGFDPDADTIVADIARLLDGANLDANAEGTGAGCMSGPDDPDCGPIFRNLGLPFGDAAGGEQAFFRVEKGKARVAARDTAAPYDWKLPAKFPMPRVPEDNPMTGDKVELGRHLFYDTRLSSTGKVSCATCHEQAKAFTDGRPQAIGATGQVHPRNSMSLANVAYSPTLTWANPGLRRIEAQVLIPMFGEDPVEMGLAGKEKKLLKTISADARYQALFAAAYPADPNPITVPNVAKALASFTRSLISGGSAYDTYRFGRVANGISVQAKRGEALFFSERLECFHCHIGLNFSGPLVFEGMEFEEAEYHNTGLYNVDGKGGYPKRNQGVFEFTGKPEDMGRFKAPTLRNLRFTAPYMHDGSVATLDAVIDNYEAGGRDVHSGKFAGDGRANPYKNAFVKGFQLTPEERAELVAFLMSLTDEKFVTDPRFSNPWVAEAAAASKPK